MKQKLQHRGITVIILLLFVFLATAFVACGSGKDKKDSSAGGQTETGGKTGTGDDTGTTGDDDTGTGDDAGGDDDTGTGGGTDTDKTGAISGSVSGTVILAVNESGDIIASYDTTGNLPGIDGRYSFTLNGIPVGQSIRLYLIRFGVYPLYFDTNGDSVSDTNVFSLTSSVTINLGFMDTNIERGKAIAENNPTDTPGVNAGLENTDIPIVINKPITTGLSFNELLANGFSALNNGWMLRARDFFKAAVDSAEKPKSNVTTNDADTARVFYALTRIAAIGFDYYSDGNPYDMNSLGDILDRLGCEDSDLARANAEAISCDGFIPDNSPTAGELQAFLYNVVRPELKGAIINLDAVSTQFNKQLTEPAAFFEGTVDLDYGDVLIVRAAMKSTLASLLIAHAYDLDFDTGRYLVLFAGDSLTTERFLDENPGFLLLNMDKSPLDLLSDASGHIAESLDDLDAGINSIQNEVDDQSDDLITLEGMTTGEIAGARNIIAVAKTCLSGPCILSDNGTPLDSSDDAIIDLTYFFGPRGTQDLRDILPPFSGNGVSGLFPDTYFGGVLVQGAFINEDIDPADGIPDILQ